VTDFPEGRTTGDTKFEFWNKALGVDRNQPLDRVFFLLFEPTSARVLKYDTSDHWPILVKLQLQP
jgi:endonuclease/exonuclease/phosphatase (EEP) superfamily protein YafD